MIVNLLYHRDNKILFNYVFKFMEFFSNNYDLNEKKKKELSVLRDSDI